ncbi:hypothetical protein M514_11889, partial [Trichuris suis]
MSVLRQTRLAMHLVQLLTKTCAMVIAMLLAFSMNENDNCIPGSSSDWWSSMLLKEVMALNKGGANVSTNDTPESSYEIGITMLRQEPLEKKVPNRSPRWAIDWSVLLSFHFVRPLKYLQLEYNQGEMISNSQ